LITKAVDIEKADYAVITGVQIHNCEWGWGLGVGVGVGVRGLGSKATLCIRTDSSLDPKSHPHPLTPPQPPNHRVHRPQGCQL